MSSVARARRSTGKNQQVDRKRRAAKTGLPSGGRREDGDEDAQPTTTTTTTTTSTNHHEWEKSRRSCPFHLHRQGSIVSTTGGGTGTDEDVKAASIEKTVRRAFINLKSVWRSTALHCTAPSIKRQQDPHFQH
ncbi:unnamed protein product [Heterobilharzia americana]|nr:unnamed protein product [Heterobilharzia americana]